MTAARTLAVAGVGVLLAACNAQQSALHPAGEQAAGVSSLFWAMAAGTVVIWLVVMGLTVYAVVGKRRPKTERFADRFILIGGVAFPTVVLAALLLFGLSLLPAWTETEEPDLRIHVTAEQYWWRVRYELPEGAFVESANEVHLPVDATVEFVLTSRDVIHSFWIPALGGKMDAIPGRTNILRLDPRRIGTYRGVCAEFCGPSHAFMAFHVEVHEPAGFEARLASEQSEAAPGDAALFLSSGCGACHTIRSVGARGSIGPDLTHVASRTTIAAGTLANTPANLRKWLASPETTKPDAHMPSFAALPAGDLDALVAYLSELR